jgi:hypothetical protein
LVFSIIFTQNKNKKRGEMKTREHSTWGKRDAENKHNIPKAGITDLVSQLYIAVPTLIFCKLEPF